MALIEAVSIALRRGDALLLVKRGRAPSLGFHAFPGGRVEPGETLLDAANRELFEETALRVARLEPFRTILLPGDEDDAAPRYSLTVFIGHDGTGTLEAGDDAAEAGFFTLSQMASLSVTPSTLDAARSILS
ncbi:MAG: NUDIX domain-containing protein [Methylobacterium mesophilicum]|nr:NUDIX domain-containing protein [Methylobacterium mesophilicum]